MEVSPDFISAATESVLEEVTAWQNRPLEGLYPIVLCAALRVKIRDEGTVQNRAVPLALGLRADGQKEGLGLWLETNEGAKFWLKVMTGLRNRGVQDNAIESLHMQLRRLIKHRGHFPSDEAAAKLLYLALRNITARWKLPPVFWKAALNEFALRYAERFAAASLQTDSPKPS